MRVAYNDAGGKLLSHFEWPNDVMQCIQIQRVVRVENVYILHDIKEVIEKVDAAIEQISPQTFNSLVVDTPSYNCTVATDASHSSHVARCRNILSTSGGEGRPYSCTALGNADKTVAARLLVDAWR